MSGQIKFISLLGIFVVSISFVSFSAFAQDSIIPDWVKNNAKWWADGQIAESDYLSSLQYLVNHGIISIPISEVTATNTNISDDERAKSFTVHLKDGHFTDEHTIYTFSVFEHLSGISPSVQSTNINFGLDDNSVIFTLQSLPSKDKQIIYETIDKTFDGDEDLDNFTVEVDIISGDGNLIQTWAYRGCQIDDYSVFVEQDKETYRFSNTDEMEIRDAILFSCRGFSLIV